MKEEKESNKVNILISSYKKDILQRIFGGKGGKTFLYALIICLGRGLLGKFFFNETFLYAFFYPILIIAMVSVVYISLKLISFKNAKLAKILEKYIFNIFLTFLIFILLLVFILVLNKFLHFLF